MSVVMMSSQVPYTHISHPNAANMAGRGRQTPGYYANTPTGMSAPQNPYATTPAQNPYALVPSGVNQMVYPQVVEAKPKADVTYPPAVVDKPVNNNRSGQVGYLQQQVNNQTSKIVERHQSTPGVILILFGFFLFFLVVSAVQIFALKADFPGAGVPCVIFGLICVFMAWAEGFKAHTCTLDVSTGMVTVKSIAPQHHLGCCSPPETIFNAREVSEIGWWAAGKGGEVHLLFFSVRDTEVLVSRHGGGCGCEGEDEIREAVHFWTTQLARCGAEPKALGGIRTPCMCA